MAADGSLKFDTKIDTSGLEKGTGTLEKAFDRLTKAVDRLSDNISNVFNNVGQAAETAAAVAPALRDCLSRCWVSTS